MNTTAASEKKQRKISSTSSASSLVAQNITQLPSDQLVAIADYLPKTSRALFAVALTAPSSSFRAVGWGRGELSAGSKAIISSTKPSTRYLIPSRLAVSGLNHPWSKDIEEYYASNWEVLNFIDIDDTHAEKLTDDDLGALLVCIDAKKKLKKMILHRSVRSIVGHGLEPLRGSRVLEEIDCLGGDTRNSSGLVHHMKKPISITSPSSQVRMIKTSLSTSVIVSVLDSIIDTGGNSLRKVIFPRQEGKWPIPRNSPMLDFLGKINQTMLTQEIECSGENCSKLVKGTIDNSCQVCTNRFCATCDNEHFIDNDHFIISCNNCGRKLCESCGDMTGCYNCDLDYCSLCIAGAGDCYCDNRDCKCGCKSLAYAMLSEENRRLREAIEELQRSKC